MNGKVTTNSVTKQVWTDALRKYAEAQRLTDPVPALSAFSVEEDWHRRIVGSELVGWAEDQIENILKQRCALRVLHFDPEPLVVFTTTMPGLFAFNEIFSGQSPVHVCLLEDEFRSWVKKHPDDDFIFHIHHWSFFRKLDRGLLIQAMSAHPGVKKESFRLHTIGDLWGNKCGEQVDHLWQWDGEEMRLLQQTFTHCSF